MVDLAGQYQEVDIRIPSRLPKVRGDRVMIGEAYRNLITNAESLELPMFDPNFDRPRMALIRAK
jgi:hypothetical protein